MSWQEIVEKYDLDISIVNFNELMGRIDAEYYRPLFVDFTKKFSKPMILGDYVDEGYRVVYENTYIYSTPTPKANTYFLQAANIQTPLINQENMGYVSNLDWDRYKKGRVKRGEILIEVKGNAEKAALVPNNFPEKTLVTGTLYKISVKKDKSKEYLMSFLLSRYGIAFRNRVKTNIAVSFINKNDLYSIPVPTPSDKLVSKIELLISDSIRGFENSKIRYNQAEDLLLSELGLSDYTPNEANISIRDLFECLQDDRFDAEYWMPKYDEMQRRVAKVPQSKLGQLVNHKKGVEVGSEAYQEEGESFIRVSDFSIFGIESVEKKISSELYENLKKNYQPKKGEVLFTKDGTIGLSYALDEDVKGVLSGAFLRLQPKTNINIHYLALVLNSLYCKYQIERISGGAIIAHLKPESAMQINIPILSPDRQDELGNMIIQSLQKRNEAKHLLEKSKRAVEIFIEQDEEKALEYLAS
jgi:restriction endonuclease S subunit